MHGKISIGTLAALQFAFILVLSPVSLAVEPVRAGIYENAPKMFLRHDGEPAGFFVELLNEIARAESWEIEYIPCAWEECLLQLESGELDLLGDVAHISSREERFHFGREVVFASWSVVYSRPHLQIETVLDLQDRKVAVLRDSIQSQFLRRLTDSFDVYPKFIEVSSFEEGYQLAEDGDADCVVVNRFYGRLHESSSELSRTNILFAPALIKFAAPKHNERFLLDALDRHLIRLKDNGDSAYYQAFDRWFVPPKTFSLPAWLQWVLIGGGLFIFGLVCLTLIFRQLVRRKTFELENNQRHLERLSHFDPVTELPNRVLFMDRLEQAARQTRHGSPHLACLFIDLDEFKQINDSAGHEVGDIVLKLVAQRITACVRKEDTVARLGGDEFTVLIESSQDSENAATVAEKILRSLKEPLHTSGQSFYLTASIGISLSPEDGTNAQDLLRNADAAMYSSKKDGRNTFRFYRPEMTESAIARITLLSNLRAGLENNEFLLHFQPLFELDSRRIVGVETLVRWNHGTNDLVPPGAFIPLAEESGTILSLGEHILREACTQMVAWRRDGIQLGRIAVNLSGKQIQRGDIVELVTRILNETGCSASWLELEVTESFIMNTPDLSIAVMRKLRNLGIGIAIDDFGTGYSSLMYLKMLPVSKLKIDRSFVHGVPLDSNDVAIARAVITLGRSLDLTVLAEGIETEDQLDFMRLEGCNQAQGYLLGPPMPAQRMSELLVHGQ